MPFKTKKDGFRKLLKDLRLVAIKDGPTAMRFLARTHVLPKLVERTPVDTGVAASAWVASARRMGARVRAVRPKRKVSRGRGRPQLDGRKLGERLGKIVEKTTKARFSIRIENRAAHMIFIERGGRNNPARKVVARTMKELRGLYGPQMAKLFKGRAAKLKRRL